VRVEGIAISLLRGCKQAETGEIQAGCKIRKDGGQLVDDLKGKLGHTRQVRKKCKLERLCDIG